MFEENIPIFRKHTVLKAEMLTESLSYQMEMMKHLYERYANGIIAGAQIIVEGMNLIVQPGIIKYGDTLYQMKERKVISYHSDDKTTYLFLRFTESHIEGDYRKSSSEVFMASDEELRETDLELCHFTIKSGAKLRQSYQDFKDYATEFDTVNIVNVPYSGIGGSTLSPKITTCFGEEMMKYELTSPYDIAFIMECLKGEVVNRRVITFYISKRINVTTTDTLPNAKIHQYLQQIIEKVKYGEKSSVTERPIRRMIVD